MPAFKNRLMELISCMLKIDQWSFVFLAFCHISSVCCVDVAVFYLLELPDLTSSEIVNGLLLVCSVSAGCDVGIQVIC